MLCQRKNKTLENEKERSLDFSFHTSFLNDLETNFLYDYLLNQIPWTQVIYYIKKRDMTVTTPRLTYCMGYHAQSNQSANYSFNPIEPELLPLKEKVENFLNTKFNFIIFSYYRNEKDSITFHNDDDSFLSAGNYIPVISLGDTRQFKLKTIEKPSKTFNFDMHSGDMIVMKNDCQKKYLHSVPKKNYSISPKFSISFRSVTSSYGSNNYYKYNCNY